MKNSNSITQPKKSWKKIFLYVFIFLIVILLLSQWIWKISGSNQWELEIDKNEVKIYTLKAPGTYWKKFKVNGQFKSSLSGIVKLLRDPDSCVDAGC